LHAAESYAIVDATIGAETGDVAHTCRDIGTAVYGGLVSAGLATRRHVGAPTAASTSPPVYTFVPRSTRCIFLHCGSTANPVCTIRWRGRWRQQEQGATGQAG